MEGQFSDLVNAKRIIVFGITGSGKTTLAKRLSKELDIPSFELDNYTYEANWVIVEPEEQRRRIQKIADQPEWIVDTLYSKWSDVPLDRADLLIGLDYPRWVSFFRLVKRTVVRFIDKAPVCNGNVEDVRNLFSKNSIFRWHFVSFKSKRARIRRWKQDPNMLKVIHIQSARKLEALISGINSHKVV